MEYTLFIGVSCLRMIFNSYTFLNIHLVSVISGGNVDPVLLSFVCPKESNQRKGQPIRLGDCLGHTLCCEFGVCEIIYPSSPCFFTFFCLPPSSVRAGARK
jgi:hypothetical protein